MQPFDEAAAYHGEIAFDPADGTILRLMLATEIPPGGIVERAGIAIEYEPVQIAGRPFICPVHGVSLLAAHTTHQGGSGAISRSQYKGRAKTFLNDEVFGNYRRFGSETRILPGE
jgi:hypothetical protein